VTSITDVGGGTAIRRGEREARSSLAVLRVAHIQARQEPFVMVITSPFCGVESGRRAFYRIGKLKAALSLVVGGQPTLEGFAVPMLIACGSTAMFWRRYGSKK
jgi:hypothetical protein